MQNITLPLRLAGHRADKAWLSEVITRVGLDIRTAREILGLLRRTAAEVHQAVVMVTRDPMAASYADTVLFLADGEIAGTVKSEPFGDHVWIPATTGTRLRSLPGVRAVVPELQFPAYVVADGRPLPGPGGTPSLGHAWTSAVLTPANFIGTRVIAVAEAAEPIADLRLQLEAAQWAHRVRSRNAIRLTGCPTCHGSAVSTVTRTDFRRSGTAECATGRASPRQWGSLAAGPARPSVQACQEFGSWPSVTVTVDVPPPE